nr:glycine cleavage system aminomethyltransferase GcvT [uncultured Holophaga sp.]
MSDLKRTPLYPRHAALGARMVDFGGWEMPIQYPAGILAEHQAVRTLAGLFDVSHMGELRVRGPQAMAFLDWLTPNDVRGLRTGRIHYTGLLTDRGTFLDDLLLHKVDERDFLLVVNASNTGADLAWIRDRARGWEVEVLDESPDTGQVALQGPRSAEILQPLVDLDLSALRYYGCSAACFQGVPVFLARTGYTGEDGFEVYAPAGETPGIWDALLERGCPLGLVPAGLGCRNTLRLEARMALYGHEIDAETTPLEAGLEGILNLEKGDFIGRAALLELQQRGVERRLVGFRMLEKRDIARDGMPVLGGGRVTSGAPSPTFACNLGLALVPAARWVPGSGLEVEIRGRACPAVVVPTPFYVRRR